MFVFFDIAAQQHFHFLIQRLFLNLLQHHSRVSDIRLSPSAQRSHEGTCRRAAAPPPPDSDVSVQMCSGPASAFLSSHWLQPPTLPPLVCFITDYKKKGNIANVLRERGEKILCDWLLSHELTSVLNSWSKRADLLIFLINISSKSLNCERTVPPGQRVPTRRLFPLNQHLSKECTSSPGVSLHTRAFPINQSARTNWFLVTEPAERKFTGLREDFNRSVRRWKWKRRNAGRKVHVLLLVEANVPFRRASVCFKRPFFVTVTRTAEEISGTAAETGGYVCKSRFSFTPRVSVCAFNLWPSNFFFFASSLFAQTSTLAANELQTRKKKKRKEIEPHFVENVMRIWAFALFFGARCRREVDPCILEYVPMQMVALRHDIARFLVVLKCKKMKNNDHTECF